MIANPHSGIRPGERILIAGCGRLGQALGRQLVAAGGHVYGLRRSAVALPEGIEPVVADLESPSALVAALPERIDVLYHIVTPGAYDDESYRRAFVTTLAHLCAAVAAQGRHPRRMVFVSSTAVYGQEDGGWLDELSPTTPSLFSGRRLLEAEALALEAPWSGVVARLGGIYGPGRDSLIRQVRAGQPCRAEGFTNRIHADDAVGLLAHLATEELAAGIYLGVDDEPTTQCQVMDYIAACLGQASPPRADTESGTRRGVGSKRCSNRKLKASGYALRYPTYREGYTALTAAEQEGRTE